jgi:hypothetical protein
VAGNLVEFKAKLLCEHDNNMRWDTILELCSRVGVKSLSDLLYKSKPLRTVLGDCKKADFSPQLQRKINEFYELRNGVVHSIAQNSGIGPSVSSSWAAFFRAFTTALAEALKEAYGKLEAELAKAKVHEQATV